MNKIQSLEVYNLSGELVGEQKITDILNIQPKASVIKQVILWQLAYRRGGNSCTKSKAEVSGTNRKPHKQKGTGKARQGSLRSPQFRGGGVTFGPKPRDYSYTLPKKIKKLGLRMGIAMKLQQNDIVIFENLNYSEVKKVKTLPDSIKKFTNQKTMIIDGNNFFNTSVRNIATINVMKTVGVNLYDLLNHKNILITKEGFNQLIKRIS